VPLLGKYGQISMNADGTFYSCDRFEIVYRVDLIKDFVFETANSPTTQRFLACLIVIVWALHLKKWFLYFYAVKYMCFLAESLFNG
jgi:hypothetical protein